MSTGKLFMSDGEQLLAEINYQFQNEEPSGWWGELSCITYTRLEDGDNYIIEMEDQRRGRCYLKKRVNRAVSGVPPRYIYRFTGSSLLE